MELYTDGLYEDLSLQNGQKFEQLKNKEERIQVFDRFINKIADIQDDLGKYTEPVAQYKQGERRHLIDVDVMVAPFYQNKEQIEVRQGIETPSDSLALPAKDSLNSFNNFNQVISTNNKQ